MLCRKLLSTGLVAAFALAISGAPAQAHPTRDASPTATSFMDYTDDSCMLVGVVPR